MEKEGCRAGTCGKGVKMLRVSPARLIGILSTMRSKKNQSVFQLM